MAKMAVHNHYETRLFKYIENITTKKIENFQIKILIFFICLLKTQIVGTRSVKYSPNKGTLEIKR